MGVQGLLVCLSNHFINSHIELITHVMWLAKEFKNTWHQSWFSGAILCLEARLSFSLIYGSGSRRTYSPTPPPSSEIPSPTRGPVLTEKLWHDSGALLIRFPLKPNFDFLHFLQDNNLIWLSGSDALQLKRQMVVPPPTEERWVFCRPPRDSNEGVLLS